MLNAILFCRHGETESNRGGWLAGSLDVALTERGRAQAAAAAEALATAGTRPPVVYTSPQRRARDTAAIIAGRLGCPVTTVPGIEERNWGALEGHALPADLLREDVPGGEPLGVFRARVAAAFASLPVPAGGGLPLVVVHAGTWQALCWCLGLAPGRALPPNAAPVLLERQRLAPRADAVPGLREDDRGV